MEERKSKEGEKKVVREKEEEKKREDGKENEGKRRTERKKEKKDENERMRDDAKRNGETESKAASKRRAVCMVLPHVAQYIHSTSTCTLPIQRRAL